MATFEQSLEEIKAALLKELPDVGKQFYGIATNVIDVQNFYIVPESLYHLMPALEQPGRPVAEVGLYSRVIYYSLTLAKHVRGDVKMIHTNGTFVIFALDYGVTDLEVTRGYMFEPLNEDDNIPGLAQLCEMVMCFPRAGCQFDEEAIKTFKFLMGYEKEQLVVTIKEKSNYNLGVEVMSTKSSPNTISNVMAYYEHSYFFLAPP